MDLLVCLLFVCLCYTVDLGLFVGWLGFVALLLCAVIGGLLDLVWLLVDCAVVW